MRLTEEQFKHRKGCILKARLWFGSDELERIFKDYDFYYAETLVHVYPRAQ